MKIGEAAKAAGVNLETVRYYERKGMINRPTKTLNGFRDYSDDIVKAIKFIKNAQKLGFSLKEIEELLSLKVEPEKDCSIVKLKALHKIEEIENKIESLEAMKESLIEISSKCSGSGPTSTCSILNSLNNGE